MTNTDRTNLEIARAIGRGERPLTDMPDVGAKVTISNADLARVHPDDLAAVHAFAQWLTVAGECKVPKETATP